MLNCEYCDYIKTLDLKSSNEVKHMCSLTGFMFHKNMEDYEMEFHPCFNVDYDMVLKEESKTSISA